MAELYLSKAVFKKKNQKTPQNQYENILNLKDCNSKR